MAFKGMFYHKQHSTSESWRLATRRFFGNQDGRLYGVPVTSSGNNVSVGTGYFIVCGGVVQITSAEVLASGASGTKTLCFQIDLGQSNEVDVFNQGSFVWITGNPTQQDLWSTGGTLYQMPIATVVTNGANITSLTVLLKDIDGDILGMIDVINAKNASQDSSINSINSNLQTLNTNDFNNGIFLDLVKANLNFSSTETTLLQNLHTSSNGGLWGYYTGSVVYCNSVVNGTIVRGNAWVNSPLGTSSTVGQGVLEVLNYATNAVVQKFYNIQTGKIHSRVLYNNSWSVWTLMN